ncbi:MAG: survival protein SurE [Actinobacteria bacterium]|nr:survival protein SurE [Actinomycetota bacterium]
MNRIHRALALLTLGALVLSACSSDGDDDAKGSSTTTVPGPKGTAPLEILVTNDDGYAAEGIDTMVEALRTLPDVKVTVVAPAENKSGSGETTTPGTLTATEQETKSGYPATAVNGFPADTINYALENVYTDGKPDLVVSGINQGQNLGPITDISGTVGAAKTAATQGIVAVATSQGLADVPDYPASAALVKEWIEDHRQAIARGKLEPTVLNFNAPTCAAGLKIRGLKQVPLAVDGAGAVDPADCASTATDVTDDIAAFLAGFATLTELTAEGADVTTTTTWQPAG